MSLRVRTVLRAALAVAAGALLGAFAYYRMSETVNRNAALAWRYLAWKAYSEGNYTEAVDAACQAVAREPGGYEPLLVQGLAYEKVGSHTLAARSLRSFLQRSKGTDRATYDRRKVKHELAAVVRRSDTETDH